MTVNDEIVALKAEVSELRTGQRRAVRALRLLLSFVLLGIVGGALSHTRLAFATQATMTSMADSVLRVRGIVVTDARGIERIWIGAPVPDPMFLGKRGRRQGPISGILMFDAMGTERNGYGTSDDADGMLFTMDNIAGQSALFLANANTGTHLRMWDAMGNSTQLGVYNNAMFNISRGGKPVVTLDSITGGSR